MHEQCILMHAVSLYKCEPICIHLHQFCSEFPARQGSEFTALAETVGSQEFRVFFTGWFITLEEYGV